MESKYANLDKPDVKPRPAKRPARSCIVILLAYNSLILTGAILAGTYMVVHHRQMVIKYMTNQDLDYPVTGDLHADSFQTYDLLVDDLMETVGIDSDGQKEIVTATIGKTSVSYVLDFKQSVGSFYASDWDECYLMGGLDRRLLGPSELRAFLDDTKDRKLSHSKEIVTYEKAADHQVTDTSLLSRELRDKCVGKPVYWLRQVDSETDVRYKRSENRQLEICLGLCIRIGRRGQNGAN